MLVPLLNKEVELKWLTLFCMVFQNTLLVLTMRYSRLSLADDGLIYLTSTAVVMAEVSKFIIALTGVLHETKYDFNEWEKILKAELLHFDTVSYVALLIFLFTCVLIYSYRIKKR